MKKNRILLLFLLNSSAFAERLETVNVVSRRPEVGRIYSPQIGSSVPDTELRSYVRSNVADAIVNLPGVSQSTNARNERTISIRGFDARQVPLFIDGIPVYVPFDGYVDFAQFSTFDLSSVEVAKGFSSVNYGANTIGGAINLISRRPERKLESSLNFGIGTGDEKHLSANLGSNQGKWFFQTGLSGVDSLGFPLSKDFRPTPSENGGRRNNSYRKDVKYSLKLGITPRKSDEYSLNFIIQNGIKGQPPSTDPVKARYWQWPYWNKQSVYYLSKTKISSAEQLTLRLYQDKFDNKVNSYSDGSYSSIKPSGAGSLPTGKSIFHDKTYGGSLAIESSRWNNHVSSIVQHYKLDEHREYDGTGSETTFFRDQLLSTGLEDSWEIATKYTLETGFAHHTLSPLNVFSKGNPYVLPHHQYANDLQAGIFYGFEDQGQWYLTVAKKNRMPTMKDRYSQRLGTFIQNPNLRAERSMNYELGGKKKLNQMNIAGAFFLNDLRDKIQTVVNVQGTKSQMQNIDRVRMHGIETSVEGSIRDNLDVSLNYTYTFIKNLLDNETKITDIPKHKVYGIFMLHTSSRSTLSPYIEYNSRRWVSNTKELPGFLTYNLRGARKIGTEFSLEAGVTNISDHNYSLADGFPSPGRMFFISLTWIK